MNDQLKTEASLWERTTTRRFLRWLFSWRGIRRVLIVLAWAVTIVGLLYGEENWRGRRAWNQYREAAEARGVSFDLKSYIPKPAPDEQNFAATPFLKTFFQTNDYGDKLTNDLWCRASDNIAGTNLAKEKGRRHFTDLVAWQLAAAALQGGALKRGQEFETDNASLAARAAAAPVVLEGMKADAAVFAELRAASTRPYSRYPVNYDLENPWNTLVPHLARIKQVCQRLDLQSCAELAAGQSDLALADVKLMLSLADSIKSESFLISFLVRVACVQIAIRPVWEGLAEHRWTDAQLQELQARFLSYDFLADMEPSLHLERAEGVQLADVAKKMGLGVLAELGEGLREHYTPDDRLSLYLLGRVIPSGWYYQEKLNYSKLFDAQMAGVVDVAAKRVSPRKAAVNAEDLGRQIYGGVWGRGAFKAILRHCSAISENCAFSTKFFRLCFLSLLLFKFFGCGLPRQVIARMRLPGLDHAPLAAARGQTAADQAALACALERYHLANGQFPETLAALTPRFIPRAPNDVITGQPYKYRRTDDGQFILYSVGWNEKDDGGVPGKTLFDPTEGNWVWDYTVK